MSFINAIKRIFLLALLIQVLPSCSIKENREGCPCTLTLDLSRCPIGQTVTIIGGSPDHAFSRTVKVSKDSTSIKQSVSKGEVHICAYSGIAEMVPFNDVLTILTGKESDRILMSTYDILCKGESAVDTLRLHKQYAEITVRFTDSVDEVFPYEILAKGSISGIDIVSLAPTYGQFEFKPTAEGEFGREFRFRVPRQKGNSLTLEIWQGDRFLSTINLGEEINKNGFNWNKEDLDDISIEMNYSHSEMNIQIIDWQDSISSDMVI